MSEDGEELFEDEEEDESAEDSFKDDHLSAIGSLISDKIVRHQFRSGEDASRSGQLKEQSETFNVMGEMKQRAYLTTQNRLILAL